MFVLPLTWPLIAINGDPVCIKDTFAFAIEVLELTTVYRPAEDAQDQQHQHSREGYQQKEDVHRGAGQRAARSALRMTSSELAAMPRPAAHGGSQPTSASGMQAAL